MSGMVLGGRGTACCVAGYCVLGTAFPGSALLGSALLGTALLGTAFLSTAFLSTALLGTAFLSTALLGTALLGTAFWGGAILGDVGLWNVHLVRPPHVSFFTRMIRRHLLPAILALLLCACSSDPSSPAATSISISAGNGQSAVVATMVAAAPTVVVRQGGQPAPGAEVTFTVAAGGGATSDTVVMTNSAGIAAVSWYMGPAAQVQNRLVASVDGATAEFTALSTEGAEGQSYFGANAYMEYVVGDLPVVISAPHGGTLTPATIPDRTFGEDARDTNTEELARAIGDTFFARLGHRPHIIICRLRRTKLDANREIVEAAQGNAIAQRAWAEWHAFIAAAKTRVATDYPRGLYMDLHGHGHAIQRLELGYLLSGSELALPDVQLNTAAIVNTTSIRALVQSSGASLTTLLRGPQSLGTLFEGEGYPSVPSTSQPHPNGADYFSGGYNTDRHGSRSGGTISGFQLEANFTGVRDTEPNRTTMANAVVDVFIAYFAQHFGITL